MAIWDRFWKRARKGSTRRQDTPAVERQELLRFLAECRPFASVSAHVRELVISRLREVTFEPGAPLVKQGEPGTHLLVIFEGDAEVMINLGGTRTRRLSRVGRGQIVGEMALLTREPRNADVIATSDVRAFVLDADDFGELVARYPELSVVLTHLLADRLGQEEIDGLGEKTLEGYRIRRRLGKGGMAVVYEADRTETGEKVALKMMSHSLVYHPEALDRFQREADIVLSLRHPRIAAVYDRFEAYRTHFIVMEYCDGASLSRIIEHRGPLPDDVVRAVLGQLAQALTYIRERNVVHRDLKPSNVMITRSGDVKLMDFGIARPNTLETQITPTGVIVGTPAYMAPEQLGGEAVDSRADAYAFGLIGYEMVAGRHPFQQADIASLMYRKLSWSLPPREEMQPPPSEGVYDLLDGLLTKNPEMRRAIPDGVLEWARPVDPAILDGIPGQDAERASGSGCDTRTEGGPVRPGPSPSPSNESTLPEG